MLDVRSFLTPPWREICVNDAECKQDWREAVRSYELREIINREQGYEPVALPKASVKECVPFLMERFGP